MSVSLEEIKKLKELTGVGLTDAKTALTEADGDFDKALEAMRKKGLTRAEKKGEREAREGLIDSYVHSGRIGVLVEVNCETDFVARTDDFKALVHDIALHISAAAPDYITLEDVPAEETARVTAEYREKASNEGKPADMIDKIVEGQIKKYFAEKTFYLCFYIIFFDFKFKILFFSLKEIQRYKGFSEWLQNYDSLQRSF
jgi:elongation factor Ts